MRLPFYNPSSSGIESALEIKTNVSLVNMIKSVGMSQMSVLDEFTDLMVHYSNGIEDFRSNPPPMKR